MCICYHQWMTRTTKHPKLFGLSACQQFSNRKGQTLSSNNSSKFQTHRIPLEPCIRTKIHSNLWVKICQSTIDPSLERKKTKYSRENYNIPGNIMVGRLCSFLNGPFWGDMLISRGISTKPSPHTKKNPQRFRAQTRPVQNLKASTCSRDGGTRWFTFTLQKPMGEKRPETLLKHLSNLGSW